MSPYISYEFQMNDAEGDGSGAYVPYVTVQRLTNEFMYYAAGIEGNGTDPNSGGVLINEANIKDLYLLEANVKLNMRNSCLPTSTYAAKKLLGIIASGSVNALDNSTYLLPDIPYEQDLYHTDGPSYTTYKFPLKLYIDRFLPKASLLSTWYYTKDGDLAEDPAIDKESDVLTSGEFNINGLMNDIKGIYNYYCLEGESTTSEQVDAVTYDNDGVVRRDPSTGEPLLESKTIEYATTDESTFIYFGQAVVESNKFGVFEKYVPTGPSAKTPYGTVTSHDDKTIVPIVQSLLFEDATFLDNFVMSFTIEYKRDEWVPWKSSMRISERDWLDGAFNYDESTKIVKASDSRRNWLNANGYDADTWIDGVKVEEHKIINGYHVLKGLIRLEEVTITKQEDVSYNIEQVSQDSATKKFYDEVIRNGAEKDIYNVLSELVEAEKGGQGRPEQDFVNYEYIIQTIYMQNGEEYTFQIPEVRDYEQEIAFYNFTILNDPDALKAALNGCIDNAVAAFASSDPTLGGLFDPYAGVPKDARDVTVTYNGISDGPEYKTAKDYAAEGNVFGIYDIEEEKIAATLEIRQRKMPVMLITSGETWAKSMVYDNEIVNNPFVEYNYRYVVPHSYFSFGLRVFKIDEKPNYRVELYEKYFSKPQNDIEAAIKEADIITMIVRWEKLGEAGNDSAYVFIRDLYKLVMCIRDSGAILPTAYSELYVPETYWDFHEGVTQQAFWTERLVSFRS